MRNGTSRPGGLFAAPRLHPALVAFATVVAAGLLGACTAAAPPPTDDSPSPTVASPSVMTTSPTPASPTPTSAPPTPVAKADPVSLDIDTLGIHAQIDLYTVAMAQASKNPLTGVPCYSGGCIACVNPPSIADAYWLKAGVGKIPFGDQPGTDATGTVYLVGHASGTKTAVFNDIYKLHVGDDVSVATANGAVSYAVQQVVVLDKSDWSTSVYANQQVPGRLVLGTCYHADDAVIGSNGSSTENVVVVAQTTVA